MEQNAFNRSSDNCFNLVRLLTAFQVMFGHLVDHLELQTSEIISCFVEYFRGVPIFFAMGGVLIWFSIDRTDRYSVYLKKRFFRIYPELWVGVLIEIVSILFLYDEWNIKDIILFTFTQSTVFQFWTPDSLRGYGCGTPNGALWTICTLIQFYIIAWFLYKLLHKKRMLFWILVFVVCVAISTILQVVLEDVVGIVVFTKLFDQSVVRYLWLFMVGIFISEFWNIVGHFLKKYWCVFLLLGMLFYITRIDVFVGYYLFWSVFMVCGVIGFAYQYPVLKIKIDISYACYIYHMIIVNIFIVFGCVKSWWFFFAIYILTCIIAYISTKSVGQLAMKYRKISISK